MSYKKWVNAEIDKAKASALSEKLNIDAFVAFLLVSRGIDDEPCSLGIFVRWVQVFFALSVKGYG